MKGRKLEVMPVRCYARVPRPDCSWVTCNDSISYLGRLPGADGSVGSDINRRLGLAQVHFISWQQVRFLWTQSLLAIKCKIPFFEVCFVSQVMYCTHAPRLASWTLSILDVCTDWLEFGNFCQSHFQLQNFGTSSCSEVFLFSRGSVVEGQQAGKRRSGRHKKKYLVHDCGCCSRETAEESSLFGGRFG